MMDAFVAKDHHSSLSSVLRRKVAMFWPVKSRMLSDQDFLCLPLLHLPSTVPQKILLFGVGGIVGNFYEIHKMFVNYDLWVDSNGFMAHYCF